MDELKAYRVKQAAERLALDMGLDPSSLVFARIDGDPIQPDSVTKMFARIAERAKIRLGHASIAITMDTYSHAIPGLQEDAAQRIDGALRSALPKN